MRLTEVGIRYRQIQLWSARKPICRGDVLTADSITIKEVAPAIIFLVFSILVSCFMLMIEFVISDYCIGCISSLKSDCNLLTNSTAKWLIVSTIYNNLNRLKKYFLNFVLKLRYLFQCDNAAVN